VCGFKVVLWVIIDDSFIILYTYWD